MLNGRRRLALGIQLAMTMFAGSKGVAGAAKASAPAPKSPIDQTAAFDFTKLLTPGNHPELVREIDEKRRSAEEMASATWNLAVKTASNALMPHSGEAMEAFRDAFRPQQLTHEQARLWLQSFNAGPYALLRYKGNVPYKETQNYYPKVLKNYKQNLSNTPYEPYIQKSAAKYGLDPQFVRAIMKTESDFRNSTVSSAGARGLMQVMPVVWSEIKKKYDLDWDYNSGVFEPEKNIEVACAYLAWLQYDFLPRHFVVFEREPEVPNILVRDKDRGVPDRPTPRIETAFVENTPVPAPSPEIAPPLSAEAIAIARAVAGDPGEGREVAAVASKPAPSSEPAAAKPPTESKTVAAATKSAPAPQPAASKPKAEPKTVALANKKTVPPPRAASTTAKPKAGDTAAPAVDEGKKVEIAFVGDKNSQRKVTTKTEGGKTVVNIRPDNAPVVKRPAVAGTTKAVVSGEGKDLKPKPRTLKKPAVADAGVRIEESRS